MRWLRIQYVEKIFWNALIYMHIGNNYSGIYRGLHTSLMLFFLLKKFFGFSRRGPGKKQSWTRRQSPSMSADKLVVQIRHHLILRNFLSIYWHLFVFEGESNINFLNTEKTCMGSDLSYWENLKCCLKIMFQLGIIITYD